MADGLVYHAFNRGNNRDRVFGDDGDFRAFRLRSHSRALPLIRRVFSAPPA
jgi:hypothetical protein